MRDSKETEVRGRVAGQGAKASGGALGLSITPTGGCHSRVLILPRPKLLYLEQLDQAPLRLPGRV